MYEVSVEEAGAKLPQILEDVKRGIEVIIKQNNIAIAKLSPPAAPENEQERPIPKLGTAEGHVWIADDFDAPLDDFADYR